MHISPLAKRVTQELMKAPWNKLERESNCWFVASSRCLVSLPPWWSLAPQATTCVQLRHLAVVVGMRWEGGGGRHRSWYMYQEGNHTSRSVISIRGTYGRAEFPLLALPSQNAPLFPRMSIVCWHELVLLSLFHGLFIKTCLWDADSRVGGRLLRCYFFNAFFRGGVCLCVWGLWCFSKMVSSCSKWNGVFFNGSG